MTITINRGEAVSIPFAITDAGNSLANKRVTWSVGLRTGAPASLLKKVGGLPGSTADISITAQNAAQITGVINVTAADYANLLDSEYHATLWVDDGTSPRCVTSGGFDLLKINPAVSRT